MTSGPWKFVEFAAQLLERQEREVVLGDLVEAGESAGHGVLEVLGLAVRRQTGLWKNWRPWLAALGLAFPCSFLLMGVSLSVSQAYLQFIQPAILKTTGLTLGPGFWIFLCNLLLLMGWSWTGGFVSGFGIAPHGVGQRNFNGCAVPVLFIEISFGKSVAFLFAAVLLPAIWGARRGLQIASIKLSSAMLLAIGVTALTIPAWSIDGPWLPNWALSWPAWYLVVTAWRGNRKSQVNKMNASNAAAV